MRTVSVFLLSLLLSGCALITQIPSFWDDNQSQRITDARLTAERLDCGSPLVLAQVTQLSDQLLWFELYSESKGTRQRDVIKLVLPIRETVTDWQRRTQEGLATQGYCEIKKRIVKAQLQKAASAVLGRY
jgi:hypothetical protein